MAKSTLRRPLTAAQLMARAENAAKRAENAKKAAHRKSFLEAGEHNTAISEKERRLRLMPRLISGLVMLPSGEAAAVKLNPHSDEYVARLSDGGYFVLDKHLRLSHPATTKDLAAVGFSKSNAIVPKVPNRIINSILKGLD